MRKIAIVYDEFYDSDYGYNVVHSISDWAVVSDEDYEILKEAKKFKPFYRTIEQPVNQQMTVDRLIAETKENIAENERKREEARQRKEAKLAAAKAKKIEKAKKLLEQEGEL